MTCSRGTGTRAAVRGPTKYLDRTSGTLIHRLAVECRVILFGLNVLVFGVADNLSGVFPVDSFNSRCVWS